MKHLLTLLSLTIIGTTTSNILLNNNTNIKILTSSLRMKNQNLTTNNDISFEKDYRFLAHDWLKVKISYDIFLDMRATYDNEKPSEVKNYFFLMINNFPKLNNTGSGGYISQDDIFTVVKVIIKNFKDINNFFEKLQEDQGLLIVTNTIGSWDKNDYMGVFPQ